MAQMAISSRARHFSTVSLYYLKIGVLDKSPDYRLLAALLQPL